MTDSLERFLQDLRFEVPAGLAERAKAAADLNVSHRSRRTDAQAMRIARRSRDGLALPRHQWSLALVAVLLAIAIVVTLIGFRVHPFSAPAGHGFVPIRHHNGQLVVGGWPWADSTGTSNECQVSGAGPGPDCHSTTSSRLIAVDPTTGAQQTLVSAPVGLTVSDAAYSPDGTKLAYVIGPADDFDLYVASASVSVPASASSGIWVLNSATGQTHEVTTCHCQQLGHLAWSPDGSRLAFSDGAPYVGAQIYVISLDGARRFQLTHFRVPQNATEPTWSPDGSWIAFSHFSVGQPGSIDVIKPDGSGLTVLLNDQNVPELGSWREPAWSPDGSRIAYVEVATGPVRGGHVVGLNGASYQLWLMHADGSHRAEIFSIGRPSGPEQDDWAWGGPAWSPDGTRIAVVAAPKYTLWVMNADGSDPQSLSTSVGGDRPTWQPLP